MQRAFAHKCRYIQPSLSLSITGCWLLVDSNKCSECAHHYNGFEIQKVVNLGFKNIAFNI